MSYEPSHRKPPRQERWPNATPGEGWPAYQQAGDGRAWEPAEAFAGSRNGHDGAVNGYGGAVNGHGGAVNGYGTTADGYGGAVNGYGGWGGRDAGGNGRADAWGGDVRHGDAGPGYWADGNGNGYGGGATTAYPAMGDGFDGAADGYRPGGHGGDGYGTDGYRAADGYGADGYGTADGYGQESYYETPRGWDGYTQPGHEFTAPADYPVQDEYAGASSVLVAPDTVGEWWRQPDQDEAPARGPVVSAVTGLLAAAVAIGVATLTAAFVRPQASPVTAVRSVFIDRLPASLKHAVVAHLGMHGQTVLLLGAIGLAAIVIGCLARRNASVGVAGIAAFGLLGAFIAITRPESRASDVVPSGIGALAGIVALMWLAQASAPTPRVAPARPAYGDGRRRTR